MKITSIILLLTLSMTGLTFAQSKNGTDLSVSPTAVSELRTDVQVSDESIPVKPITVHGPNDVNPLRTDRKIDARPVRTKDGSSAVIPKQVDQKPD